MCEKITGDRRLLNPSSGIKAKELFHGLSSDHVREGLTVD